jgi:hydrogenase-1 operon protein HyaE
MNTTSPSIERLRQRVDVLQSRHGFRALDAEAFDAFVAQPGTSLVLFAEDPAKVPETWDLTVILPDLVASLAEAPRVGMLAPAAARTLATRYGIRLWPALLVLRDGAYLGAVEGLQDWSAYMRRLPEILAAAPSRPPSIGIPVANSSGPAAATCH